ncbi:GAF domain-containing protein [Thermobifida cellulosilytica]|uniref:GAF domain-containing protein n=1 Tax=Thermobifida cellulosilytica TaxID=144786 RepID=UPI000AA1F950|nr:GAF domain-containing protein [Thermobifida cellulosilytica]
MTTASGPGVCDSAPLLARAVRELRRATGLPVAFGGPVARDGRGFVIDQLSGARTRSLLGLRVRTGAGLGGRALALARPWAVDDYLTAEDITHVYDHAVAPERLRSIVAAPVRVGGATRAVLYVADRRSEGLGDRALAAVARVVRRAEQDFAVEEEVQRRLAALSTARPAPRGPPRQAVRNWTSCCRSCRTSPRRSATRRRGTAWSRCAAARGRWPGTRPRRGGAPPHAGARSGWRHGRSTCWPRWRWAAPTTRSPRRWACCPTR